MKQKAKARPYSGEKKYSDKQKKDAIFHFHES